MRILLLTIIIIVAWHSSLLFAQPRTISNDAIVLTLQEQSGILLDSNRAFALDSSLRLTKQALRINPNTDYRYGGFSLNMIEVEFSSTNTLFVESWLQGKILTGNARVDSLSRQLGLIGIDQMMTYRRPVGVGSSLYFVSHHVRLQFRTPLRDDRANFAYRSVGIVFPGLNGGFSSSISRLANTSRSLDYFQCNGEQYFIFGSGSGDCPAGCINYSFSYASVRQVDTGKVVTTERVYGWADYFAPPFDRPYPRTIPYNFPRLYSVTQFRSADSLIKALQHPIWWVQNHAVQGMLLVFTNVNPTGLDGIWVDSVRSAQWTAIRQGVLPRRQEVIRVLQEARKTAVCDVGASIDTAIAGITSVSVNDSKADSRFNIIITPNPFTDAVHIISTLPLQTTVRISVINALGSNIATIFEGYHNGKIETTWLASSLPQGMYIIQVSLNGQIVSSTRLFCMK